MADMPVTTTPFSFNIWLVQLVVSILFASGFTMYYRQLWHMAFTHTTTDKGQSVALRILMLVMTTGLGLGIHAASGLMGASAAAMIFDNFGLFILVFPVLDEGSNLLEFTIRAAAIYGIWAQHFAGSVGQPRFFQSLFGITATLIIMRVLQERIRYHIGYHALSYIALGVFFWWLSPKRIGEMTRSPELIAQALITFSAMSLVTGMYLKYDHHVRQLNAENAQQAHYDALTNSKNYAAYRQDVTDIFRQAQRDHTPVAMAVLDIDHFKQINDHYGHLAGDDILAGVAESLENMLAQFPGHHTLYRTGGEEFNVVFPGRTARDIQGVLLECWRVVRETRFPAGQYEVLVTISIGIAELQDDDTTFDDLYARADKSLYQSKHYGRDAVTVMGKTLGVAHKPRVIQTSAFFNQRVVDVSVHPQKAVHNEIRLAQYDSDHDQWLFPQQFELPVNRQIEFAKKAMPFAEVPKMMMPLSLLQFGEPSVLQQLVDFKDATPALQVLVVELMEIPSVELMQRVAPLYKKHDIRIMFTAMDVTTNLDNLKAYLPYLDGFKFDLRQIRANYTVDQLATRLSQWHAVCDPLNIDLLVTGIENSTDAKYAVNDLHAHYVQGYFYDRPALPRMG